MTLQIVAMLIQIKVNILVNVSVKRRPIKEVRIQRIGELISIEILK